jgi:hypothetical protein
MKKSIYTFLPILILGGLASLFLPWWIIGVVCFGVGAWNSDTAVKSYLFGMAGVTLLWTGYAGFMDHANGSILSTKIGELIGKKSGTQMIFLTGLIGGIVGGLSTMSGSLFRKAFFS